MSNIQTFLKNMLSARYGKDVRQSIHDAIQEVDKNADTAKDSATAMAEEARKSAETSSLNAQETKKYRDEAKQFRDEAFATTPDGYAEVVETVAKNTVKIDTVIEKADLGIKETASGEEIHLTDSAEGKAVEFALYGKAKQNVTSGNQLFDYENKLISQNGLVATLNADKSITIKGTPTKNYIQICLVSVEGLEVGTYYVSGGKNAEGCLYVQVQKILSNDSAINIVNTSFSVDGTEKRIYFIIQTGSYQSAIDYTIYPMINKGSEPLPFEPYTGGIASPNPDYPQEIEVSGESYNLLENTATSQTINGVEFVVNEDGSVTANGTASADTSFPIVITNLEKGKEYKISTGLKNSTSTTYFIRLGKRTSDVDSWGDEPLICLDNEYTFIADSDYGYVANLRVMNGVTVNNLTFYSMIRKASVKNDRYMPYGKGSVEVKSVGKNLWNPSSKSTNQNGDERYGIHLPSGTYTVTNNSDTPLYYRTFDNSVTNNVPNESVKTVTFNAETIWWSSAKRENIQIEEGSVATKFEPYKETLSSIPTENGLAGIKVSSNGNYTDQNGQQWICDEIVKYADGSGEKIQRIGILSKDDVKNNAYAVSSSVGMFYINGTVKNLNNNGIQKHILCNYYSVVDSSNIKNNTIATYTVSSNGDKMITIKDTRFTTIEEFKAFVDNSDIKIHYVYAEPITTPLTAEELAEISTFYPVTNISNDADCGMKVTYLCDSKNYIDSKIAELATAMVNNI